jgi:hypothetical protein
VLSLSIFSCRHWTKSRWSSVQFSVERYKRRTWEIEQGCLQSGQVGTEFRHCKMLWVNVRLLGHYDKLRLKCYQLRSNIWPQGKETESLSLKLSIQILQMMVILGWKKVKRCFYIFQESFNILHGWWHKNRSLCYLMRAIESKIFDIDTVMLVFDHPKDSNVITQYGRGRFRLKGHHCLELETAS